MTNTIPPKAATQAITATANRSQQEGLPLEELGRLVYRISTNRLTPADRLLIEQNKDFVRLNGSTNLALTSGPANTVQIKNIETGQLFRTFEGITGNSSEDDFIHWVSTKYHESHSLHGLKSPAGLLETLEEVRDKKTQPLLELLKPGEIITGEYIDSELQPFL